MNERIRVLVVEDNPGDVELVRETLPETGPFGFELESVARVGEAVARLSRGGVDLVLLDLGLPDGSGLDTFRQVRRAAPAVPTIVLTVNSDEDTAVAAVKEGAQDYLVKGQFTGNVLLRAARYALERKRAEAALAKSEAKYRALFESSRDAIMTLFPPDWKFTSANSATVELFGAKDEREFTSLGPWQVSPERQPDGADSAIKAKQMIAAAMARGSHFFEWTHQRINGQAFPATVLLTRVEWEGRMGLQATVRDITEWKRAEADIRHLNRLLRAIRDIDNLIVCESDPQRLLQEACESLIQTRGYLLAWIGRPDPHSNRVLPAASAGQRTDFLDQITVTYDDSPTGQGPIGAALRARQPSVCQDTAADPQFAPWREAARERGFASVAALPIIHEERLFGALSVYADHAEAFDAEELSLLDELAHDLAFALRGIEQQTEGQRAEEQVRAQARLLDLAHDAIAVRDMNGLLTYCNKAFERITGWTAPEALGKPMPALLGMDALAVADATGVLLARGEWSGELNLETKAGLKLIVMSRWSLARDARGRPEAVLTINTDITAKKQLETQFLRAQRLESLGFLASGIAHDLNNALAPIHMAVDLLRSSPGEPLAQKMLDTVDSGVKRATGMVQQILTFARGVEGKPMRLQLQHLLNDLQRVVQDTFPKTIKPHFHAPRDLWPVVGDPTQLYQVLLNLTLNARDAMPHGGTLTVTMENAALDESYTAMNPEAKAGPHVLITVADTGTGMSEETKNRLFEPFFTTKEPGKGTGLGLSTSLGIVKGHGGLVQVLSEPHRGATFKVYVPAEPGAEVPAFPAGPEGLPGGHGELVLVVDDEAGVRSVCQRTLEQHGYRVLTASQGAEAVALFAQHRPEIAAVLTDMIMPVMDGPAAIQALRSLEPRLPIVAMSGQVAEDIGKAVAGGLKAALTKPFTAAELLRALAQALA